MFKSAATVTTLAAILSIGALTLTIGGCGDATTSATPSSDTFTVEPYEYIRYSTSGDGKMSFTVTGIDMDKEIDNQPIVHFFDSLGYGGGRATGGFQGDLRNYKLKYYGSHGILESEDYHGFVFKSDQSYDIVLEWKTGIEGYVQATVNGAVCNKPGAVAENFTVGIGWPPAVRNGWAGAVYTDIVWPKGSQKID